ncbi:MAG: TIGR03557 family F420-dependent LLM class oxidoreductase [Armatimonadetes bacterium]|nr:TIGR03557 family F420-dependent LLM class oxidoreductase [Armatimonadota bacterium]
MKKHIGYAAMFEQFHPTDLLKWCQQAEAKGFGGIMASDHFNPWTPEQGQSAFVWSWLGALGMATSVPFVTGVTPPGWRYHPAIIAQAACTVEAMFPGRFWLGLGAGEALNEHIVGGYWPEAAERVERLLESIEMIRKLFSGQTVKHRGKYYTLESARIYTMPEKPPPIFVATSGPYMSLQTGKVCDGLITVGAADEKIRGIIERFEKGATSVGKDPSIMPRLLQLHVSWAPTDEEATQNAVREWPNGGMNFPKADIREPEVFAAIAKMVRPEHFKGRVHISSDPKFHANLLQHFIDLGFDAIYVHNVGRNQAEYIEMMGAEVIPALKWPERVGAAV